MVFTQSHLLSLQLGVFSLIFISMNFNAGHERTLFLSTQCFPNGRAFAKRPSSYSVHLFPLVRFPSLLALETDGWPRDDNFKYHTNTHRMRTVQCLRRLLHLFLVDFNYYLYEFAAYGN